MEAPNPAVGFLHVDSLSYAYHTLSAETLAIEEISFDVSEGEFLAIVGPCGYGNAM